MLNYFEGNIPQDILDIYDILSLNGEELHLVGGAVRDSLMGRVVQDFDLATSASPQRIQTIFQNNKEYYLVPTGIEHGTWTLIKNKISYEITTYRIDGEYKDSRHPDNVSFTSSLKEDLSRRDFTMNAIAVNPKTREIIDIFGGQEDIQSGTIRTVGDSPLRFKEDALRMLRACRFASQLDFNIEFQTLESIKELSNTIQNISQERIRDELLKVLSSKDPRIGLELMRETGILAYILPELIEGYGVDQNEFHKFDVYTHNLMTCYYMPPEDTIARLAALLHDIGKPRAKNFALKIGNGNVFYNHEIIGAKMSKHLMKRLKFSNDDIAKCVLLVELHMFYYTSEWNDGAIRRFLRRFDGDIAFLELLFKLREADRSGSGTKKNCPYILHEFRKRIDQLLAEDAALKISDLNINGRQLMDVFSLSSGPIIGQILNHLLELVLDDPIINNYDTLMIKTKEFLKEEGVAISPNFDNL